MIDGLTLDVAGRAVAAALLHSVWQGALAAGLAAVALRVLRGASAQARYAVACAALAGLVGAWTVTAIKSATTLTSARATTAVPAAPLLGAGPLDFSAAIQPLPPSDSARDATRGSWRSRLERWAAAAVPLWLAGVLLLSLRLTVEWIAIERLRRVRLAPAAADLRERVAALARTLGVSRPVRLAHSAAVHVPSVVGWLRPVILLPASAVSGLSPAQLDAVLAHELAHIRRHDFAVNALQTVAEVVLFYHPACWWISRRIRVEREHCCDDAAVAACGDRLTYASALADLESLRQQPSLALAATDGPLLHRVRRLVTPTRDASSPALTLLAVPLVALVIVIAAAVVTRAAQPQAPEQLRAPGVGRTIPANRGIIEGRVVDAQTGRPIEGAKIEVHGPNDDAIVTTDQAGRYETRPLMPATYSVMVSAAGYARGFFNGRAISFLGQSSSPQFVNDGGQRIPFIASTSVDVRGGLVASDINIALQAVGWLSGRVLDDRGRGLAGASIVLSGTRALGTGLFSRVTSAQSDADGVYRVSAPPGEYTVRAYIGTHVRPSRDAARAYVATYYPGVRAQPEAQGLRVDAALEQYDVDFALMSSKTVRVAGTVADPARGDLAGVHVSLQIIPVSNSEQAIELELNALGAFDARDVVPGTYIVTVRDPHLPSRWSAATRQIEITEDVTGLDIQASAAATIKGRLVRDPRSTAQVNLSQVLVAFVIKANGPTGMTMARLTTEIDGSFHGDAPPGPVVLSVSGPRDWRVHSILLDRVEVPGQPFEVPPGDHDMEVVLTDRMSTVSGLVVDRRGTPLSGFDVVLFPEDVTRWHIASPFIRQTRSRQTGQFDMGPVPPGDYLAVATQGVPLVMIGDPEPTLRQLQAIGTRLKIAEGEHKTISIRASPTPEGLVRFTP